MRMVLWYGMVSGKVAKRSGEPALATEPADPKEKANLFKPQPMPPPEEQQLGHAPITQHKRKELDADELTAAILAEEATAKVW